MNYDIWRDLRRWNEDYNIYDIKIVPCYQFDCITIGTDTIKGYNFTVCSNDGEKNYYFPVTDGSFGSFIKDKYEEQLHTEFISKDCICSADLNTLIRSNNSLSIANVTSIDDLKVEIDAKVSIEDVERLRKEFNERLDYELDYNLRGIVEDMFEDYATRAEIDEKIYYGQSNTDQMLKNNIISIEANTNNLKNSLYDLSSRISEIEANQKRDQNDSELLNNTIKELIARVCALEEKQIKRSNNNMKGFNFDFGSCANNNAIRMSMYGLAVQNAMGSWVSYDPKAKQIVDVDIMNFDNCGQYLFKMPVAITDIKVGDIVIHNRKAMFITEITDEGKIIAIDPHAGEEKIIVPTTSPFGFNFVTKIISMFDAMTGVSPTPAAPFGNMLPFLMMENDSDIDPMMMMLMMNGGQMDFSNPMLMYMMCKNEGKMSDMLPFMLMMPQAQHKCNCGNHN